MQVKYFFNFYEKYYCKKCTNFLQILIYISVLLEIGVLESFLIFIKNQGQQNNVKNILEIFNKNACAHDMVILELSKSMIAFF